MTPEGLLFVSLLCLLSGVLFFLFPGWLLKLSSYLNRSMITLDQKLMRHRYLVGTLLIVSSYLVFSIALTLSDLRIH